MTQCRLIDSRDVSFLCQFSIIIQPIFLELFNVLTSCPTNMARLYYECNVVLKNSTEDGETIKPYACTPDKYCLYCCCNSQCCLLVQRRPPRHFWEAWYFWLGIALLAVFIISSVSNHWKSITLEMLQENHPPRILITKSS